LLAFFILNIVDVASHISLKIYKAFFPHPYLILPTQVQHNTYFNITMASNLFSSFSEELDGLDMTELEGLDMTEILGSSLPGEGGRYPGGLLTRGGGRFRGLASRGKQQWSSPGGRRRESTRGDTDQGNFASPIASGEPSTRR